MKLFFKRVKRVRLPVSRAAEETETNIINTL